MWDVCAFSQKLWCSLSPFKSTIWHAKLLRITSYSEYHLMELITCRALLQPSRLRQHLANRSQTIWKERSYLYYKWQDGRWKMQVWKAACYTVSIVKTEILSKTYFPPQKNVCVGILNSVRADFLIFFFLITVKIHSPLSSHGKRYIFFLLRSPHHCHYMLVTQKRKSAY